MALSTERHARRMYWRPIYRLATRAKPSVCEAWLAVITRHRFRRPLIHDGSPENPVPDTHMHDRILIALLTKKPDRNPASIPIASSRVVYEVGPDRRCRRVVAE
jgi:hypothetical protein